MNQRMQFLSVAILIAFVGASPIFPRERSAARAPAPAAKSKPGEWVFAVSGDSRNCGDVVMPAIAVEWALGPEGRQSLENQKLSALASAIASGIAQVRGQMGGRP